MGDGGNVQPKQAVISIERHCQDVRPATDRRINKGQIITSFTAPGSTPCDLPGRTTPPYPAITGMLSYCFVFFFCIASVVMRWISSFFLTVATISCFSPEYLGLLVVVKIIANNFVEMNNHREYSIFEVNLVMDILQF